MDIWQLLHEYFSSALPLFPTADADAAAMRKGNKDHEGRSPSKTGNISGSTSYEKAGGTPSFHEQNLAPFPSCIV